MENLKTNLHYIVFAAGIVIGGILLFVGITMRGAQEEEIATRANRLKGQTMVKTDGDLSAMEDQRGDFDSALEASLTELQDGFGVAFRRSLGSATDAQRFKTEADAAITDYRNRFNALARPVPLPERMRGWVYRRVASTQSSTPWQRLTDEIFQNNDAQKIPEFRKRLRALKEVCVACETLIASGRFGMQGVELRDFKFDSITFSGSNAAASPWETLPFTLRLDCSPEFALALMAELSSPTALTAGMAQDPARSRVNFPILVDSVQMAHVPRPVQLRYDITNEMKANEGIDAELDPTTPDGSAKALEKASELDANLRPVLPMDVGLRLRALAFNPEWSVVAEEQQ